MAKLLEYTPEARLSAVEAMCHPFFDELRLEGMRMPNGKEFPPLFNFTREGAFNPLSMLESRIDPGRVCRALNPTGS